MNTEWIGFVEIAILGATLLTTVALSLFIALQARRHFRLQHAKEFIARFNGSEMVRIRDRVDRWLVDSATESNSSESEVKALGQPFEDECSIAIRTFINFFQELGVAWKHGTVHHEYTWDLFAGLTAKYWQALSPYCKAQRIERDRPTLFNDFENLAKELAAMDLKRNPENRSNENSVIYIFGYGSLISAESAARTLGREPEPGSLKRVWLNGFERSWSVFDSVQFYNSEEPIPTVFLNLVPHQGRRCNGILIPVKKHELELLDKRERSYKRLDVSKSISPALDHPVHTYVGRKPWTDVPDNAVVAAKYLNLVKEASKGWGSAFENDFNASTSELDYPLQVGTYAFVDRSCFYDWL